MERVGLVEGGENTSIDTEQLAVAELSGPLNGHNLSQTESAAYPAPADETASAWPDKQQERNDQTLANVYTDPTRHTVSLLLDDRTANCVIYAVRALAADYEAHARETRLVSATLPPDSYGAVNRLRIAGRHERIAARLRVLERNYQSEVGGWCPTSPSDEI